VTVVCVCVSYFFVFWLFISGNQRDDIVSKLSRNVLFAIRSNNCSVFLHTLPWIKFIVLQLKSVQRERTIYLVEFCKRGEASSDKSVASILKELTEWYPFRRLDSVLASSRRLFLARIFLVMQTVKTIKKILPERIHPMRSKTCGPDTE
jgi:hypothetical protein